jgi:hypothetical protein
MSDSGWHCWLESVVSLRRMNMSEFWGYPGADVLAIVLIAGLSALTLYHARKFVSSLP